MADGANLYIVTIDVDTPTFRGYLERIEKAWLVRELGPGQVVVGLGTPLDHPRLSSLPGVTAVEPDRLEHPDRPT